MVQKILGKNDISKNTHTHTHVWLSGRLHIEGRLNEARAARLQRNHKGKNDAKQNKRNTRERRHDICKPNARRAQVVPLVTSQQGRANQHEPALLWAILSLILPVTFGHTTACRSSALVFSAVIHFAMKCSAPCSAVLRYSPSSWAAVVH